MLIYTKFKYRTIVGILLVLIFSCSLCMSAFAAEKDAHEYKIVRVAFPEQDGVSEKGTAGDYSSYTHVCR